ncbi:MAG: DUF2807 domain-containing protein [Prevotella sp.]|nr:DUF2807 domain-containing protein [Prevotella sp.]
MTMTLAFSSCDSKKEVFTSGNPSIVSGQPVPLEGSFDRINISGVDEVTIAHGDSSQVILSGDEDAISRFSVSNKDNLLVVKKTTNERLLRHQRVHVHVVLPVLHEMNMAGIGNVKLQDETKTDRLDVDINGCGSMQAKGIVCDRLKMSFAGVSKVDLDEVTAQDASMSINGVGSVQARFTDTGVLNCSANGTGSVSLKGNVKSFSKKSAGVGQFDTKELVVE